MGQTAEARRLIVIDSLLGRRYTWFTIDNEGLPL